MGDPGELGAQLGSLGVRVQVHCAARGVVVLYAGRRLVTCPSVCLQRILRQTTPHLALKQLINLSIHLYRLLK